MKTYPKPKQKIQISTRNSQKRYPRPRTKPVDSAWGRRSAVPAQALDISDDIVRLELILKLLWEINPLHIGNIMTQTQRDSCGRSLRTTTAVIKGWKRTAQDRLAKEFLI